MMADGRVVDDVAVERLGQRERSQRVGRQLVDIAARVSRRRDVVEPARHVVAAHQMNGRIRLAVAMQAVGRAARRLAGQRLQPHEMKSALKRLGRARPADQIEVEPDQLADQRRLQHAIARARETPAHAAVLGLKFGLLFIFDFDRAVLSDDAGLPAQGSRRRAQHGFRVAAVPAVAAESVDRQGLRIAGQLSQFAPLVGAKPQILHAEHHPAQRAQRGAGVRFRTRFGRKRFLFDSVHAVIPN
ncbi:hypothetical protein DO70_4696 [Burkholderia pseudomallei]|nr:hypothetical protein DO70_4696 [Burkholderia pseudomallei]